MGGSEHTFTTSGALYTVARRHVPVHRVSYRPDPWSWTPWEYAGTDGRFHGRWDDPHGTWRTLYAGFSPWACYLEVLAVFRADSALAAELDAILDHDGDSAHYPTAPVGTVPKAWCAPRLVAAGRLTGAFAVPGHPESLPTLRHRFLPAAKAFGLADLDAAAIRDSRPRALTQAISAWIYTLPGDGQPLTGIEFQSRHGDNLTLWAIYERDTTTTTPPEVVPISANPVDPNDSDLKEAMRLHRLTWST